jgi:hypothetical protein
MTDVFSDPLDEHQSAFVDPWSHQPQNWGDIPDHAVFAGAWHLNVGIDTIHEALFLARDDRGDRLWSLTTSTDTCTRESLTARERGDRAWIKRKISCGCVAGAARQGTPRDAASILMNRLVRSRLHFSGSEPPYIPGLLTSQEMAAIVDALEQELTRITVAAEADQQSDEAAIITAARDLKLNPRPAGTTVRRGLPLVRAGSISSRSPPLATNFIVATVNDPGGRRSFELFVKRPSGIKSLVTRRGFGNDRTT